jgi:hypothetical protein
MKKQKDKEIVIDHNGLFDLKNLTLIMWRDGDERFTFMAGRIILAEIMKEIGWIDEFFQTFTNVIIVKSEGKEFEFQEYIDSLLFRDVKSLCKEIIEAHDNSFPELRRVA